MGNEFVLYVYENGQIIGLVEKSALTVTPGVMETVFECTWHATGARVVDKIALQKNGLSVGEEKTMSPIHVMSGDTIKFTYTLTMAEGGGIPFTPLPHVSIPKFTSVEEAEAWLDAAPLSYGPNDARPHAPNGPCKVCGDLDDHFGKPHDQKNVEAQASFWNALRRKVVK